MASKAKLQEVVAELGALGCDDLAEAAKQASQERIGLLTDYHFPDIDYDSLVSSLKRIIPKAIEKWTLIDSTIKKTIDGEKIVEAKYQSPSGKLFKTVTFSVDVDIQ